MVIAIYVDSWIFVFATAIIQFGFGVDYSFPVCDSAILLCLLCYVSSKVCFATVFALSPGDANMSVPEGSLTVSPQVVSVQFMVSTKMKRG